MRYKFYREHKYVSAALNHLERLIARTDFRDPVQIENVSQEFTALAQMLEGHAQYENERLHTLLKNKGSKLYEHAEDDHEQQDEQLASLRRSLDILLKGGHPAEQIERGYQFYLAYRKFVADNLAHLHEEETIILPELQRLYSDAELREVELRTYRIMTPQQMIEMTQVLFPHMNISDKEVFLSDIKEAAPEKFSEAFQAIKSI